MTDSHGREETRSLVDFAGKVLYTGDTLAGAAHAITAFDPGPQAFGAEGAGGFGELCRALHGQWRAALEARAREAESQGSRLIDTAQRLGRAAANYADADVTLSTEIARTGAESTAVGGVRPPDRQVVVRPDTAQPE